MDKTRYTFKEFAGDLFFIMGYLDMDKKFARTEKVKERFEQFKQYATKHFSKKGIITGKWELKKS